MSTSHHDLDSILFPPMTTSKRLIKVSCGQASAAALPLRGRGGQGGVRSAVRGRRGRAGELWLAESRSCDPVLPAELVRSTATSARASWPRHPPPPPCPASPPAPCPPSPRPSPTRCCVWLHSVSIDIYLVSMLLHIYLVSTYPQYLHIYPTRSRPPAPTLASPAAPGQAGTPAWTQVIYRGQEPLFWCLFTSYVSACLPSGRGSAARVPA